MLWIFFRVITDKNDISDTIFSKSELNLMLRFTKIFRWGGRKQKGCRQTKQTLQRFVQCENYTPLTPMTVEKFATSCQLVPVCSHKLHMYHSAISLFKKYTYVFHAYAFQFQGFTTKTIHLFQNFLFRSKFNILSRNSISDRPIKPKKLRNEDFSHFFKHFLLKETTK